jgi:hypothetical protein
LKFTVVTPSYRRNSGGVWFLHFLCSQLNALGHKATVFIYTSEQVTNFGNFIGHDPDAVVIYPEVITNNPLNAKKVVRYLLNKEAAIDGKPINWGKNDFTLSFSKLYKDDCNILTYPIVDLETTINRNESREYNSFYVGKGSKYAHCPPLPGCTEITIYTPREEFINILNKSKIFFTYDTLTSTNLDAVFCGAMPYFLLKPPKELKDSEYGKFWIESLDADEVQTAKENNKQIIRQVIESQKTFLERLAKIVDKIAEHFKDV